MKKVLIAVLVILGIALAGYFYVFHKPHRDVQSEEATVNIAADHLLKEFTENLETAQTLYLEQTTEVKGIVSEVSEKQIILEPGIICAMADDFDASNYKSGLKVIVKGRVISYDDLMGEVRIDNAAVIFPK